MTAEEEIRKSRAEMQFRRATLADAYLLLDWRNDPATRAASLNGGEIQLHEHMEWLARSLERPDRQIFIAEIDRQPVGTVRMDCLRDGIEISWTVAPERRGQGVGLKMVQMFAGNFPCAVMARVKADNEASQRIAVAAGMRCISVADGCMLFEKPRAG